LWDFNSILTYIQCRKTNVSFSERPVIKTRYANPCYPKLSPKSFFEEQTNEDPAMLENFMPEAAVSMKRSLPLIYS
jgi:hypothetical protein